MIIARLLWSYTEQTLRKQGRLGTWVCSNMYEVGVPNGQSKLCETCLQILQKLARSGQGLTQPIPPYPRIHSA